MNTRPKKRKAVWLNPFTLDLLGVTRTANLMFPSTAPRPKGWESAVLVKLIAEAPGSVTAPEAMTKPRRTKKRPRETRVKPTRKRHTRRT